MMAIQYNPNNIFFIFLLLLVTGQLENIESFPPNVRYTLFFPVTISPDSKEASLYLIHHFGPFFRVLCLVKEGM